MFKQLFVADSYDADDTRLSIDDVVERIVVDLQVTGVRVDSRQSVDGDGDDEE